MYVCIHIYIYIYMYIYVCIYVCIFSSLHINVHVYTYMIDNISWFIYTCIYIGVYIYCTHKDTHTHTHTHFQRIFREHELIDKTTPLDAQSVYIYIYIYTYTYIYICEHIITYVLDTHTQLQRQLQDHRTNRQDNTSQHTITHQPVTLRLSIHGRPILRNRRYQKSNMTLKNKHMKTHHHSSASHFPTIDSRATLFAQLSPPYSHHVL